MMAHIKANVMTIALVVVTGHHPVGELSVDRHSTQDVCFGPKKHPTLTLSHYPPSPFPAALLVAHIVPMVSMPSSIASPASRETLMISLAALLMMV